jgi:diaminohydroxyphosphoribosylaminopyrimidine deaminase/5-amino-6-(5-phosphoribosylamino)uracil reductase
VDYSRAETKATKEPKATEAAVDIAMMGRALFHAARGAGRTTPNPMVGAVVTSADGVLVGHGWHERAGEPHAEIHALNEAGELARGGTLYATLEPCCHVGRTGPCTRRIIEAGISRVVAAMRDPDPRVSGCGFTELRAHGIQVDEGVCQSEAARLNHGFVTVKTLGRPLVILKAATSLDARVSASAGVRTRLTSREADRQTQLLRASVDAIAVGSQTVFVDDPVLTVRECSRARPLIRVVFDRRARTPPSARLFSSLSQGAVIIFTGPHDAVLSERAAALRNAGARVIETSSLAEALAVLVEADVSMLLVEGGPTLQAAFCKAKLVDRLHLIVSPHILGPSGIKWLDSGALAFSSLVPVTVAPRGPDLWIEADVHRNR